jgi:hypothetical protein
MTADNDACAVVTEPGLSADSPVSQAAHKAWPMLLAVLDLCRTILMRIGSIS